MKSDIAVANVVRTFSDSYKQILQLLFFVIKPNGSLLHKLTGKELTTLYCTFFSFCLLGNKNIVVV
jgi:hypothetical protein